MCQVVLNARDTVVSMTDKVLVTADCTVVEDTGKNRKFGAGVIQ